MDELNNNELNNSGLNNNESNNNELNNSGLKNSGLNSYLLNNNEWNNHNETNGGQDQNSSHLKNNNFNYTYKDGNYQGDQADNYQYAFYPTPAINAKEKKPKKKRRLLKAIRFMAAAVIFGVFAGAATSGYDYLTRPKEEEVIPLQQELRNDPIVVTPTQNVDDATTIVSTDNIPDGIIYDVSDIVEKVMPSIVAINSSATMTSYDFFGRQFNEPKEGSGSGIIIGQNDDSILVLTNNHVIQGAETVEIVFFDETTADAVIKGSEANADLAVLQIDMKDLSKETLTNIKVANLGDSMKVKAGEMAIAIGNALGYGQSVTVGYISALDREIIVDGVKMNLLQTDAAINPGNSGGALINTAGEVIGMNSVKYASAQVEGMGYAIPITDAIPIINQLMEREVINESEIGFLGIYLDTAQEVTEAFSQQFNMPIGIYINGIVEDSPAEQAGMKQGYIITEINDIKVETIEDLTNALSYHKVGDTVTLAVSYLDTGGYEEMNLSIVLAKKPKQ
ncbi:MAG TPA: trypsin-like peptidase domain-containing protein [Mobilitalea sp.]|nr:trypsin-like peptidase domain-containing protein [Mobilitalea sp.]